MDEALSLSAQQQLSRFSRQYLQLQRDLDYPNQECLRSNAFQQALYHLLLAENSIKCAPPQRFQLHVLKELLRRIEGSIQDWEEEGIFDDLMNHVSFLLASSLPPEADTTLHKSYVTYTLSSLLDHDGKPPTITILESRNLVAAAGTTGLRTWEAALHLGNYLCTNARQLVRDKAVLELGSGTGFVSILCAKHLGAKLVIASDGSDDVVAGLPTNFSLNGLQDSSLIEAKELKWGKALVSSEYPKWNEGRNIDLVLGADVTYDGSAILALLSTFGDVCNLNPYVKLVIAAVVRNPTTFETFRDSCLRSKYSVEYVDFKIQPPGSQQGPFYSNNIPIQVCRITKP